MNWGGWLLWGFVGTVVLTAMMAGSQGMRLTRMNLPYMLGTMFTADRDRALSSGFDDYLRKPVEPATLVRTVHRLLLAQR